MNSAPLKTLAAYLVYWGGMVLLFLLCLVTRWKQEKIRWWEDEDSN